MTALLSFAADSSFLFVKHLSTKSFHMQCALFSRELNSRLLLSDICWTDRSSDNIMVRSKNSFLSSPAHLRNSDKTSSVSLATPTRKTRLTNSKWTRHPVLCMKKDLVSGPMVFYRTVMTSSPQVAQQVKDFKDIPGPEGLAQWPVIGTVLNFKPFSNFTVWTLHLFLASLIDQYGPIVRFQFAGPTVLLSDPKDAEVLFQNEGRYPIRPPIDLGDLYCKRNNIDGGFNEL
ncbi:cytochrome P450 10 [Elysia marginata]|uniref:Cytochrome P450 10 n=1 Tax=Elysia marginata TaxID=1093978 RepID=A0AAV4HI78_9GAST|nr:cytochrome P450 10 [Elysia marginata]